MERRAPVSVLALVAVLALALAAACQTQGPATPTAAPTTAAKTAATPAAGGTVAPPAATAPPKAAAGQAGTATDAYYTAPEQYGVVPARNQTGTFRYASSAAPATLDPHPGLSEIQWSVLMLSTYDPLVHRRLAPDIQPLNTDTICRLCESWSVSADNRTYTFRLRNNVKWHDGRPMTADDVVFSFQRAGNRDNRFGIVTSRLIDMESVSKVDEQTVRIVTTGPAPDFLIDIESVMIVPKHVLEADPNGLRTRAVGTGPYRLTSYDSNVAARFEKNRDYYVAGRPWMDGMEIVFLADRSAQQAGFLAGQLDFYTVNDKAEFEPLQRARPDIGVQSYQAILANGIGPNQRRDPWNRLEVRRALHLSIDRQRLNEQLAFGGGLPVNPPSTSVFRPYALPQEELLRMPGFNPQTKQQDIASARQLLAQAGFPNGIRSTMFTWRTFSSTPRQVEAIGPMAAAAGIELELQLLEAGVAQTNWTRGDFDLAVRPMNGQSWPGSAYGFYLTGANDNYYGINDPTLDGLIRQQATVFNRERRYELLRQVQRRILDQMHVIPIIELNPYAMWQARVNNFRHYSLGAQPYPLNGVAEVIWLAR